MIVKLSEPLWQTQDLPGFDQVRIAQLICVQLEDLHVVAGVAEMFLAILLSVSPDLTV